MPGLAQHTWAAESAIQHSGDLSERLMKATGRQVVAVPGLGHAPAHPEMPVNACRSSARGVLPSLFGSNGATTCRTSLVG